MKNPFAPRLLRLLLVPALATASLTLPACLKDAPVASGQDYSAIDEGIITRYLSNNVITNAQRQASGLYYLPVTTNPTGVQAAKNKTVRVHYTGQFLDGSVFDTSKDDNKPIEFVLGQGQVIAGWDEGIALMRTGEKSILLIPSALAYGSRGRGPIPPNTVLRFEVELLSVQ